MSHDGVDHLVEVISPAPRPEWNQAYDADPNALVTQSPQWTDGVCASARYRDASRYYRLASGRGLVLPLVAPSGVRSVATSSGSMPASYGFGGLLTDTEITSEHTRIVWRDLAHNAPLRLRLRPNPLHAAAWASKPPANVRSEARTAHVLDLAGGFDTVWADRFDSGTRRGVRKAEKAGMTTECGTDQRQLRAFSELFALSVQRWARKQHEPQWLADIRARRRDPITKFETLAKHCGSAFKLWVAWQDEEPVAAIIVLEGSNAHYTRGAMNQELAGPTRANDLLHRLAIESACESGCRYYHMGETGSSESLARFKKRFGAVAVNYAEYFAERLPIRRADQLARSAAKRIIGFRD